MRTATLKEITNNNLIANILRSQLDDLMETNGDIVVPFNYSGWETTDFISNLSFEIAEAMYERGKTLGHQEFKNFDPEKTKITQEMLEEIWLVASKKIGEKLFDSFKGSEIDEIPGLDNAIKEGAIIAVGGMRASAEAHKAARERLLDKVPEVKFDRDILLRNFRNAYFDYLKKEFGLFKDEDELGQELKVR